MASDTDRVWELMEKISICMLTTHDGEQIRSRPMAAFVRRDEDAVYFLGDAHRHKDEQIAENPNVGLAFADGHKFVSVTGHAAVSHDKAKIKELWEPVIKTWFTGGVDDPRITVIKVTPTDGYYWDTKHGNMIAGIKMLIGAAVGKTLDDSIEGTLTV